MNKTTGERLRSLRKSLGLTIHQVYARTGIMPSSVSQHERNEASPRLDALVQYAGLYGVSIDWIAGCRESGEDSP